MVDRMEGAPKQNVIYRLSFPDGNAFNCIYEGVSAEEYCFTTRHSANEWKYCFLRKGDFEISGLAIRSFASDSKISSISRLAEPVEFLQIKAAWDRAIESA